MNLFTYTRPADAAAAAQAVAADGHAKYLPAEQR